EGAVINFPLRRLPPVADGPRPLVGTPRRTKFARIRHLRVLSRRQEFIRAPGRASLVWRRGWDSNPRSSYPDSSFRDCPIRPLSHLSVRNVPEAPAGSLCGWLERIDSEAYREARIFSIGFLSLPGPLP